MCGPIYSRVTQRTVLDFIQKWIDHSFPLLVSRNQPFSGCHPSRVCEFHCGPTKSWWPNISTSSSSGSLNPLCFGGHMSSSGQWTVKESDIYSFWARALRPGWDPSECSYPRVWQLAMSEMLAALSSWVPLNHSHEQSSALPTCDEHIAWIRNKPLLFSVAEIWMLLLLYNPVQPARRIYPDGWSVLDATSTSADPGGWWVTWWEVRSKRKLHLWAPECLSQQFGSLGVISLWSASISDADVQEEIVPSTRYSMGCFLN